MAASITAAGAAPAPAERLPVLGLLALAMTGFVAIMTETIPAGLLHPIGAGLGVADAVAGQLVTAYAAGSVLAAIPLVTATLGWRRRTVLLLSVAGLLFFNSVTAMSSDYSLTMLARFLAGVSAGLAWGLVGSYARRMVVPRLQGRALAVAMIGTPIALSIGVPAGTLLGELLGWRMTFGVLSGVTLVLIGWILCFVPDFAGQAAATRVSLHAVLLAPALRPVLFVVFAWMLAHNVLYIYVVPFAARAGLDDRIDFLLMLFGLFALLGIIAAGRLVDRHLRSSVVASLLLFALVAVVLIVAGRVPSLVFMATALWGLSFGGASTLLNTAAADAAGEGADISLAGVTTVWNAAIAAGGMVGGFLLTSFGPVLLPVAVLGCVFMALAATLSARSNGFPGARAISS